jgi:surface protein
MEGMFDYCSNLNYIDLSSFNMTKVSNTKSMFSFVAKTGIIKINDLFGNYKSLIPKNWTIVN